MASSAPIIKRSILFEVKSCPYMFYAGFQKGPVEFRTCPLDVDTLEGVSCPTYPTLAARGQDKRTPTYPTHKPDPLTTYPLPGKEPEPRGR